MKKKKSIIIPRPQPICKRFDFSTLDFKFAMVSLRLYSQRKVEKEKGNRKIKHETDVRKAELMRERTIEDIAAENAVEKDEISRHSEASAYLREVPTFNGLIMNSVAQFSL